MVTIYSYFCCRLICTKFSLLMNVVLSIKCQESDICKLLFLSNNLKSQDIHGIIIWKGENLKIITSGNLEP